MTDTKHMTEAKDSSFRRAQAENALWKLFRVGGGAADAPTVFRARLRKLFDLDRSGTFDSETHPSITVALSEDF